LVPLNSNQISDPEEHVKTPDWLLRFPAAARLYRKYERHVGILVFIVGFVWDSITMTRVDSVIDNIILMLYLIVIGLMIALSLRRQSGGMLQNWVLRIEPYFLWVRQFCFGGMFSSFVVFYFKSVSWSRTQFFFIFLVILLVGNEFLHHRLQNANFLAVLYIFCLFAYLAFFLPVIFARVDATMFVAAGVLSLVIGFAVFALAYRNAAGEFWRPMMTVTGCMVGTFLLINLLYFNNLIPPVPLSLKSAGIYHEVSRAGSAYRVRYVPGPFYRFWKRWDDPFYFIPGDAAYCYSAIFVPPRIRVPIRHVWSRRTPDGWVATDEIGFEISGGRDTGYRGFTRKKLIAPGEWRVDVETEQGQILGRVDFTVVPSPTPNRRFETKTIF
jgi:hypothetical protein